MRVVIAPDSFGGTLSASQAAAAIAEGWRAVRPEDQLALLPMSDGGEGLLEVVAAPGDREMVVEVADPLGRPRDASLLVRSDGTAVIESAAACGLALLAADERRPLETTTYGVGQLLDAARAAGARRILVGLGGSATVDGGAGALTGLGFRLRVEDGSGLKIGGGQLRRVARVERGWAADWDGVEVDYLADVETALERAAAVFGPQKGAGPREVAVLAEGLAVWADVAERDLAPGRRWRDAPGSGAAGGLGFGLACALGGRLVPGAQMVGELVDLDTALAGADLVITGEGRLDSTTAAGKVVSQVLARAREVGAAGALVVGQVAPDAPADVPVEASAPNGPGPDPFGEVVEAAARLARRR